ncbi:MAG: TetR/AcrR family transcriptional regulator [Deinococcota bacterium]
MGRDADPSIREGLLEQVLAYLLEHSLADLSLRPLAEAIDTNARMLIYHFGSKEQMIVDALALAQTKQLEALAQTPPPKTSAEAELQHLWQWFSSDAFLPFSKLLFEVEVQAFNGNELYLSFSQQTLNGWLQFVQSRFAGCDAITAHLIVSTFSGLLLDVVINNDVTKVNATFDAFAALIGPKLTTD